MLNVQLSEEDWVKLLNFAASAPYSQVAPLMTNITNQLMAEKQKANAPQGPAPSEVN